MRQKMQQLWEYIRFHKKLSLIGVGALIIIVIGWNIFGPKTAAIHYQTAQVTKGTLVVSVSESGSVAVANRLPVTTNATGIVSEVDVKNGDTVAAGQVIAKITLDSQGQQKQDAAWANYLAAQNALLGAQADLQTLQVTLFKTNQAFVTDRGVPNPSAQQQADPVYIEENASWLAAEAAYKNQQNVISQDQASLSSAWLSYQQVSSVVTAPQAGIISDITITPGMQIAANTPATVPSTIASIKVPGNPVVSVTLSELDATKIKAGQKATVTFDALPNQTFTGKVLGVNTTGSISSGVTTYPATIMLDMPNDAIFPNMSATANIITDIRQNVLLVPLSAVQTIGGQSLVQILQKNGQPTMVPVTIGESSDSQTEIVSGVSEGQAVVTNALSGKSATASPFNSTRAFGGGALFRAGGR